MTTPDDSSLPFLRGDVLAGKYRVERVLGRGGMGVVVAAHHVQLDERVALKFLLPEVLEKPQAIDRFVQEARAAAKIKSEHVARVTDVGQLDSGLPYIVMEYLEGSDLGTVLAERGQVRVDEAIDWVLQACEAIAEAHALGIVHRDLKPSNLFCVRRADGRTSIKLLDFGTSKIMTPGAEGHNMTRTNAVVGSPLYMSPEQMMSSKDVDARTDIWSLGTILFELVTGSPPFSADTLTELAVRVTMYAAPTLRSLCPGAPAGLEQVVATCLEKDVSLRYASVADLAVAVQPFGSPRARASVERVLDTLRAARASTDTRNGARTLALAPASGPASMKTASPWSSVDIGRSGARSWTAIAAVTTALLLGVVVAGFTLGRPRVPSTSPQSPDIETASQRQTPGAGRESASPPSVAPQSMPSADPAPSFPPKENAVVPPSVRRPATPTRPPKPDCDPPYVLNAKGSQIYKRECL